MFIKLKAPFLITCSLVFLGNTLFAGNLSLYSFSEEGAVTGMPNLAGGDENVAIGDEALLANQSGSSNTAIGDEALRANTSGSYNTAIGKNSLYSKREPNQVLLAPRY